MTEDVDMITIAQAMEMVRAERIRTLIECRDLSFVGIDVFVEREEERDPQLGPEIFAGEIIVRRIEKLLIREVALIVN